jgi:predicted  nucleic acid-binding Zn-ribbon protein
MAESYRCERCGVVFSEASIRVDARDDRHCPQCGSLRILRVPSRREKTRDFLLEYNRF